MGTCAVKAKGSAIKGDGNNMKEHAKRESLSDLGSVPSEFNAKIDFLCNENLAKHLRKDGNSLKLETVLKECNINTISTIERIYGMIRSKLKEKLEIISKNIDNKGAICTKLAGEFNSRIRDTEFKALSAMAQKANNNDGKNNDDNKNNQNNNTTNIDVPGIQNALYQILGLTLKVFQAVISIILAQSTADIVQWWDSNSNNNNNTSNDNTHSKGIVSSLSLEILNNEQMLSKLNEKYHIQLQKYTPRPTVIRTLITDGDNFDKKAAQDVVTGFLDNVYGEVKEDIYNSKQQQQQQQDEQQLNQEQLKGEIVLQAHRDHHHQEDKQLQQQQQVHQEQTEQHQQKQEKQIKPTQYGINIRDQIESSPVKAEETHKIDENIVSAVVGYLPNLYKKIVLEIQFAEINPLSEEWSANRSVTTSNYAAITSVNKKINMKRDVTK